jgi:hypothetical protein
MAIRTADLRCNKYMHFAPKATWLSQEIMCSCAECKQSSGIVFRQHRALFFALVVIGSRQGPDPHPARKAKQNDGAQTHTDTHTHTHTQRVKHARDYNKLK